MPWSTGCSFANAAQDMFCLRGCKGTLLACAQLFHQSCPKAPSLFSCLELFCPRCRALHLSLLHFMQYMLAQYSIWWGLSKWQLFLQEHLAFLQVWLPCTNLVQVHSIVPSRSFIKMLHSIGCNIVPWGTLLVISCQFSFGPVITTFKFCSLAAFHPFYGSPL